jgi:hypothetical protein
VLRAVMAAALAWPALAAWAGPPGCEDAPTEVALRVDNDFFAQRDEGYTSGLQLQVATPELPPAGDDACLDPLGRWLQARLDGLRPGGDGAANLVYGLAQTIYTPRDGKRREPDPDDRPYAGVLTVGAGFNRRDGDALRSNELLLGVVGPASGARGTQSFFHRVFSSQHFRGWSHQLENEPVFMLRHQRAQRQGAGRWSGLGTPLAWDAITAWGAALGNLRTAAEVGLELRLGRSLPDDFGSNPARSGPEGWPPPGGGERGAAPSFAWHAFLALEGRWVLHDIALDGNSFRDGPSVDRRPWVGDVALGLALRSGRWRMALARTYRSREFDGQHSPPSFGSLTLARSF